MNAANLHRWSIRLSTTRWERWSMGNCANGICTNEKPCSRKRLLKLSVFEMQTDHLITARRPDLEFINKKKRPCCLVDFAIPADHWVKIEVNKKIEKYLDFSSNEKARPRGWP